MVSGSVIKDRNAESTGMYSKVSVIDNGVGFEPKYSEKIFDIFKRLNNAPTAQGSGIGLAICKRIVQNHYGFIRATAQENIGARFDIYFPEK
jgi:signal transduction histidine kinase